MEDYEEFMDKNHKCADSLRIWLEDCGFDEYTISRVFMDYFMAYCQKNEIPLERTLTLVKKLYILEPLFFSSDSDDDSDEHCCCEENDEDDQNFDKGIERLDKLANVLKGMVDHIKELKK